MSNTIPLFNKKTGKEVRVGLDQVKAMKSAGYHDDAEKAAAIREKADEAAQIEAAKKAADAKKDK